VLELTPPGWEHGSLQARLASHLGRWAEAGDAGAVVTAVGFVLARDPDTVRAPDVAFVRQERVPAPRHDGYFEGAPDLAIEIRSPTDRNRRVADVMQDYLAAGTRLVWVVDPRAETVTEYRRGTAARTLNKADVLRDEDLLPGWSLAVATLLA
jgi:Uma2 family endonuclease